MIVRAGAREKLDHALELSTGYLLRVRRADGSWLDYVSSSALATGVCLLSLDLADSGRFAGQLRGGCDWLRQTQHEDGGWGDAVADPGNLNSTAFAVAALHRCDRDRSGANVRAGLEFIERSGGRAALRDRARCSLSPVVLTLWAVAGLCPWRDVPRLPIELALFPPRLWRRVAFTVPAVFSLGVLHGEMTRSGPARLAAAAAEPRALRYLADTQGANGGYQESPLLNGVVYVGLRAAGRDGAVVDGCLDYILRTQRPDGSWTCERDLELSVTTLVVDALAAAGTVDPAALHQTVDWLRARQFRAPFPPTGAPAGAWSWGYPSGWPDTEDTAGALTALLTLGVPPADDQIDLGYRWLAKMQNRTGSWGMFVRNSRITIDRPCPALTARVLMAFHRRDADGGAAVRRALGYLRRAQSPDGSFHSLWFRNHSYATAAALEAHARTGAGGGPVAAGCVRWLLRHQNDDGSWGGRRGQAGTAEETGAALAGLSGDGVTAPADVLDRAAGWLMARQQPSGEWAPAALGVYYLSLSYSSDHVANAFALRGLGRYRERR